MKMIITMKGEINIFIKYINSVIFLLNFLFILFANEKMVVDTKLDSALDYYIKFQRDEDVEDLKTAIKHVDDVLKIDSCNCRGLSNIALYYDAYGKLDSAEFYLNKLLKFCSDTSSKVNSLLGLGKIYLKKDSIEKSISLFKKVLVIENSLTVKHAIDNIIYNSYYPDFEDDDGGEKYPLLILEYWEEREENNKFSKMIIKRYWSEKKYFKSIKKYLFY